MCNEHDRQGHSHLLVHPPEGAGCLRYSGLASCNPSFAQLWEDAERHVRLASTRKTLHIAQVFSMMQVSQCMIVVFRQFLSRFSWQTLPQFLSICLHKHTLN
jgi:hypothetical protein